MTQQAPRRSPEDARQDRGGAEAGALQDPEDVGSRDAAGPERSEPSSRRVLGRVLLVQLVALALLWALQAAYHR